MGDQQGREPARDAHVDEHRQQRRPDHHLRGRHRDQDQVVRRAAAEELVPHERQRQHGADRGRDQGRGGAELDARHQRVGQLPLRERVQPVVEREALPGEVVVAPRIVEREHGDHRDRDQHVGDREPGVDADRALAQPPQPATHLRARRPPARGGDRRLVIAPGQRPAPRDPEVDHHHRQDQRHQHERERRRDRVVGDLQVLALDRVPDHRLVGAAEEVGVDVVADRGDERQQHPGDDPRRRQRQRHAPERAPGRRVQVPGCLDQAVVEALQVGVDRQDHERKEVVGEPGDHRGGGVEHAAVLGHDPDRAQELDHRTLVEQDRLPREGADQVGGEERRDHRQQQHPAPPAGAERDRVRERVGDQQRQGRGHAPVQERAQVLLLVVRDRVGEVRELPREPKPALQRAGLERDHAHEEHGHDEEQTQPQQAGAQQQVGGGAAPQPETTCAQACSISFSSSPDSEGWVEQSAVNSSLGKISSLFASSFSPCFSYTSRTPSTGVV